ncbi:uncharacterized protein LOC143888112 [Tasmannia lanceolata]|uniref:uncharacterized protein LOC143888112 n=1 Tax=Tasmannia lanceolata TaxID=3420 RepID=UPI004063EC12
MDLKANGFWTDEKHISFLNRIEALFVQSMLQNDPRCSSLTYAHRLHPPLDRYLPDTAESTLDFKNTRHDRLEIHVKREIGETKVSGYVRSNKKTRRSSPPSYNASQDQVVPELGIKKGDKDEKEEVEVSGATTKHD